MTTMTEKAVAALEQLPEELHEPAVAYLVKQAEKYRQLKELIAEGLQDLEAGRVSDWDFETFLARAERESGSPAAE
jgi:hypothetical protein